MAAALYRSLRAGAAANPHLMERPQHNLTLCGGHATQHPTDGIRQALEYLEQGEDRLRERAAAMLSASGGKLYAIDLVAIAALRRSLTQSASFRLLIEKRHFPSAAVLLRTQLDSALRFSAFWHVVDPDGLARDIIRGIPVRDHIDLQGKKLTDARLKQLQTADSEWVPEVYDKASGFVHLSESHLAHAFSAPPGEDSSFRFFIGIEDEDIDEATYLEAIAAFDAATDLLLEYIERWTTDKSSGIGIAKGHKTVGQAPAPEDIVRDAPT